VLLWIMTVRKFTVAVAHEGKASAAAVQVSVPDDFDFVDDSLDYLAASLAEVLGRALVATGEELGIPVEPVPVTTGPVN
jgi:hypothetical protein